MKSSQAIFNTALNCLTALVAVLALGLLVRQWLVRPPAVPNQGPVVGSRVELPGVNWSGSGQTLIVAMQVGCHWCEASADFYRDLIRSDSGHSVRLIAVLPQSVDEGRKFLRSLALDFPVVRQADLATLNVYATPTLVLADGKGRLTRAWTGMLSPDSESDLFKAVGLTRIRARASTNFSPPTVPHVRSASIPQSETWEAPRTGASRVSAAVVDVRPLPEFQKGHIEGALNIPQDELEARLIHEVPPGMAIEIYCHYCAPCELSEESEGVETYCSTSALWVKKLGFSNVSILKDSLAELSARGVSIVGSPAEAFISGSTPVVR